MTPDHGELLYEGKAKRVFASADPDRVLVEFKMTPRPSMPRRKLSWTTRVG